MYTNFFVNIDRNDRNQKIIDFFKEYAEKNSKQVYLINKALGTDYDYSYNDVAVVLIPGNKITIINTGDDHEQYEEYCEDFIEDLGYISDKYNYKNSIGRLKKIKDDIFIFFDDNKIDYSEIIKETTLTDPKFIRISKLIISLLTGSINDIDKVGVEVPVDVLDAVNRRIVLYDTMQTSFIFNNESKKTIKIQGLAGTGKTELLLRKLKELYTNPKTKGSKIVFTCFNKILANNLKERVPVFFDYLKVEEQIKWNETLFVMSSWGSGGVRDSGVYSYICKYYKIDFLSYSYNTTFDIICRKAIEELKDREGFTCCFDYMLIDEGQDFPQSFFDLCELVTKNQIYIAGDVFQNIFDDYRSEEKPDYLLNKCYRTDPKTLLFAHTMGMGLLDSNDPENYISWLSDEEWEICGYKFTRKEPYFVLTREPINRFEDIDISDIESVNIIEKDYDNYIEEVISIVDTLKNKYTKIIPNDIGVIFLENDNKNYEMVNRLESEVFSRFGWKVNKGYESKVKKEDTLFVSNINNVKGLEFPFVICLSKNKIGKNSRIRNAIYMSLTRSFISSYFVISSDNDKSVVENINNKLKEISERGSLTLIEPNEKQKEEKRTAALSKENINKSQQEIADDIMDKLGVEMSVRTKIHLALPMFLEDENDESVITNAIKKFLSIKKYE